MSCGCARAQKACLERYRSASREIIALLHKTAPQVQPQPLSAHLGFRLTWMFGHQPPLPGHKFTVASAGSALLQHR